MKKIYEAWRYEGNCIAFADADGIKRDKSKGIILEPAEFLHRVEADTLEEAMAVHYIKMGWSYTSIGEAAECPNGCGAMFYPEGSGECPNCGRIC